jgi:hypothetical protein
MKQLFAFNSQQLASNPKKQQPKPIPPLTQDHPSG